MKNRFLLLAIVWLLLSFSANADDKYPVLTLSHSVSTTVEADVHQLRFLLLTPVIGLNDQSAEQHLKTLSKDLSEISESKFYKPAKFDYGSLMPKDKNKRYARMITFESNDFALLDKIYREISQRMNLKSELRFIGTNSFVSNERIKQQQDKMYKQLMQELLEKAQKIAEYSDFDEAELIKVNIHSNNRYPSPLRATAEIAADSSTISLPVADRESTITVSANAEFKLDN